MVAAFFKSMVNQEGRSFEIGRGIFFRRKKLASSSKDVARKEQISWHRAFSSSWATIKMDFFASVFHCCVFLAMLVANIVNLGVSIMLVQARISNARRAERGKKVSSDRWLRVASCCHSLFFSALNF